MTEPKTIWAHPEEFKPCVCLTGGVRNAEWKRVSRFPICHNICIKSPDECVCSQASTLHGWKALCPPPAAFFWSGGPCGSAELLPLSSECVVPCVLQITAPKIPLIVWGERRPRSCRSAAGRQEKGTVFWTLGPDSSFSAPASAAPGEIREEREMEWVWIREERNAGQGQGKAERFDCFGWLRAAVRPS